MSQISPFSLNATSQSAPSSTIVSQPQQSKCKGSKIWRVLAFSFVLISFTSLFGLVFFYLNSQDLQFKLSDTQTNLNAKALELAKLQEAADINADIADDSAQLQSVSIPIVDFKAIRQVTGISKESKLVANDSSFIKNSAYGKYQIARFEVEQISDWSVYLYRELPNGDWQKSNFSGQGQPDVQCSRYTVAEREAFSVIEYSSESKFSKNRKIGNLFTCLISVIPDGSK